MNSIGTEIKPFPFPYSVADTESGPILKWTPCSLNLQFTDYLSNHCEVVFSDVSHFELLAEEELNWNNYQYDGVVEVVDSLIIKKLVGIGEIPNTEVAHYRHLVIGFNEIGACLVVICKSLESK